MANVIVPSNSAYRYPELPDNVTMEELVRRWSELIKVLEDRDQQPIRPAEVYGRNIIAGGPDQANITFVTAGTTMNPAVPGPGYWYRYTFETPRDVGMVLVQPVSVSSGAQVQVLHYLPDATKMPEGRTISYVLDNFSGVSSFAAFRFDVLPAIGSGNQIIYIDSSVIVNSNVSGSLNVSVTVSTRLQTTGGVPIAANLPLEARTSALAFAGMVGGTDYGSSTFFAARNGFSNDTTVSGSLNISVSSVGQYNPGNYTYRAFGNRWVQIA